MTFFFINPFQQKRKQPVNKKQLINSEKKKKLLLFFLWNIYINISGSYLSFHFRFLCKKEWDFYFFRRQQKIFVVYGLSLVFCCQVKLRFFRLIKLFIKYIEVLSINTYGLGPSIMIFLSSSDTLLIHLLLLCKYKSLQLELWFLFIVTIICLMIKDIGDFFAYMTFFNTSMLGLVTSSNLIQIYIFWELVGMCSYLLIGFWFTRPIAASACQKAFVTNRVGDFGLLLGILGLYWITGSFEFRDLFDIFNNLIYNNEVNFFICYFVRPSIICRCGCKIRTIPTSCMVTRCHGRAYPYFSSYTCCYYGRCRNFSCSSPSSAFHSHTLHNECNIFNRYNNSIIRSDFSSCSKRYKEKFSLFYNVSIGLYDVSSRYGVLKSRFISFDYSCLFESLVVFRIRINYSFNGSYSWIFSRKKPEYGSYGRFKKACTNYQNCFFYSVHFLFVVFHPLLVFGPKMKFLMIVGCIRQFSQKKLVSQPDKPRFICFGFIYLLLTDIKMFVFKITVAKQETPSIQYLYGVKKSQNLLKRNFLYSIYKQLIIMKGLLFFSKTTYRIDSNVTNMPFITILPFDNRKTFFLSSRIGQYYAIFYACISSISFVCWSHRNSFQSRRKGFGSIINIVNSVYKSFTSKFKKFFRLVRIFNKFNLFGQSSVFRNIYSVLFIKALLFIFTKLERTKFRCKKRSKENLLGQNNSFSIRLVIQSCLYRCFLFNILNSRDKRIGRTNSVVRQTSNRRNYEWGWYYQFFL
uniref:NADH-plastoquinone oxidoreductase subunit 5 n=1 Tax=Commiphora gileadensis TaxID=1700993 RepID=A0A410PAB6_9ROSI|nr:NADH-plastoquinone oxidoreductase subunit 5 [Commiphora gileadensis]QAT19747.1 NADH-plastoquinone oxidoreductase subunit 5 [Commiphora gileadensis]